MPPERKQFYNNVLRAASVEVGQRRDRRKESELIVTWAERGGKILEIGSNLGYFTGRVAEESGSHVVGIDTNTSKWVYKIARLRNRGKSASFVQGQNFTTVKDEKTGEDRVSGFAFQNDSFDQAIISHVIEHFEDPTVLINEIKRVLKDNGTIIVSVPREHYLGENTSDHKVLYASLEQLRTQLEGYGFKLVDEKDFGLGESAVVKMRKTTTKDEGYIEIHEDDRKKMLRAIELSRTSPEIKTFRVGCVITDKNGKEIATGFTGEEEGFHAEEIAIRKLKAQGLEIQAKNGSIFSTVEPCEPRLSGKMSCTKHILTLGLARVLYVLDEPTTFVECKGAETLREQGLKVVQMPEFKKEILEINQHILKPKK